jgi:hypothetical protein
MPIDVYDTEVSGPAHSFGNICTHHSLTYKSSGTYIPHHQLHDQTATPKNSMYNEGAKRGK